MARLVLSAVAVVERVDLKLLCEPKLKPPPFPDAKSANMGRFLAN